MSHTSRVANTKVEPTDDISSLHPELRNPYGAFSLDGREYVITHPKPPRPWANIIANPRIGFVVSHSGSGHTWIDNSQLAVITRWQQDFAQDTSGKFLYVRDSDTDQVWSLSPAPTWVEHTRFACRHGLGYTTFETEYAGIRARWTMFVHATDTVELWKVELENLTDRDRRLEISAYLEWNCGVQPSPRREFHKLFLETEFDAQRGAVFARNHMWDVPSERFGHWNSDFPYVSAFGGTEPILSAQGDQAAFIGRYGTLRSPVAIHEDFWKPEFGRHADPIAALRSIIELRPGQKRTIGYALAVSDSRPAAEQLFDRSVSIEAIDSALNEVRDTWAERLESHRIDTPDDSINFLMNDWVRYQAISGRLWGRAGYYQQSGAFGFRDQLQDSQVWLTIDPSRCRDQIRLHAAHQFSDGSVYHWWHPLSEQGHITKMTDDLLWLSFVMANYIRETGDLSVLWDEVPFVDDKRPAPLIEHVMRAFERVFKRTSPRGLPLIGAGDWNDGLSAVGLLERGESVWLGQFLAGLLADWCIILRRSAAPEAGQWAGPERREKMRHFDAAGFETIAADFDSRRQKLIAAINEHAWDGDWYWRATLDDGSKLGSKENRVARIFLNAQTWAVLNDIAPPERARRCMESVKRHLVRDEVGPLLLAPAFDKPVAEVGYITRYAAGLRENGGVYMHAATWAIAAAAKARDAELVGRLLDAINPARKHPERYWAEPYVLPGNVDGPDSPHFGRGGWTWYTGSNSWMYRLGLEGILGIRREGERMRVAPCIPRHWPRFEVTYRLGERTFDIDVLNPHGACSGVSEVWFDGARMEGAAFSLDVPPGRHRVRVVMAGPRRPGRARFE